MDNNKAEKKLRVIHGDSYVSPSSAGGVFVSAEATNTRLMGVIGIHTIRRSDDEDFHQLFYLDMEEYGFDDYQSFRIKPGDSTLPVDTAVAQLFGGLGGKHVEITEKEAVYLICLASTFNTKNLLPLPEGEDEYIAILDSPVILSTDEHLALFGKISEKLTSYYSIINYYIMRAVGQDRDALKFLALPEGSFDTIPLTEPGTLYRNEIEERSPYKNSVSSIKEYLSTSFIEDETGFRIIRSSISVIGNKVSEFRIISDMNISPWEAANVARRNEYIIYRHMSRGIELLLDELQLKYPEATVNIHLGGTLLMLFRKDNSHVSKEVYRLDNDVLVSIYLKRSGEVLIAGFEPNEVIKYDEKLEVMLEKMGLKEGASIKYAFPEPTLGRFITGDGELYDSFLEFIQIFSSREDE